MHPTLTQVPPRPHLVPWGEGLTKSARPTLAPLAAAAEAAESPPDPPPITKKSYVNSCYIIYYQLIYQKIKIWKLLIFPADTQN